MTLSKSTFGLDSRATKKARNFITVFSKQVVELSKTEMRGAAREMKKEVKGALLQQKYRHVPLSEEYAKRKEREGLDPRILIATKEYVDSIDVRKRKRKGKIVSYEVGPPRGIHQASGLTYAKLSRIHEFGAFTGKARIPARPTWRPAWSIVVRRRRRLAAEIREKALRAAKK